LSTCRFDYRRAIRAQRLLARRVLESLGKNDYTGEPHYIAGVDAAYSHGRIYAAAVIVEYPSGRLIEKQLVVSKPPIPYVPGLLSFREAPAYLRALLKLRVKPDIIMVDGHGLSHPRAMGIATHLGLVTGKPTIGVAKKKLYGEIIVVDGREYIRAHGHIVGEIIRHRNHKLYVSIGYRISLEKAVEITRRMLRPQYNLPLPTHYADQYSKTKAHEKQ
jgi:deoxyribonuclease V